ncbi:hypothetical protein PINS_up000859 [Pythium insidiosum]|nr:hypothetical protein PINS_up000859 [Pythium insidiosum]
MDLNSPVNNFASSTASTRTYRPTDIVLLEEADLYRYHDLPMDPHELSTAPTAPQSTASRSAGTRSDVGSGDAAPTPFNPFWTPAHTVGSKRAISIDTIPSQHGAIRPGGAIDVLAREHVGLLYNWFIIGFFNGGYPALLQPLFLVYLHYEGYQAQSVLILFSLAWYFKFLLGFVSDSMPINRQRRKPYMLLGWSVFAIFMTALACMRKEQPYSKDGEIINDRAQFGGPRYVVPIMLASFAHLLATVASEGFMIEVAHREGEFERGRAQCFTLIARFSGELVGGLAVSVSCYGPEYGGTFAHSVPLGLIFGAFAVVALLGVAATYYWLTELPVVSTRQPIRSQLRHIWRFIERRTTWQTMAFAFLVSGSGSIQVNEMGQIESTWLEIHPLMSLFAPPLASLLSIIAALVVFRWLLNSNWRYMLGMSVVLGSLIMLPIELLTTFNVVRNQYLWVGVQQLSMAILTVSWIVPPLVFVEIADPGYEATCYGILTTLGNVAVVVVTFTTNMVSATFAPEIQDVAADTHEVRWHVASQFLVKAGVAVVVALAVLPLLPRQKRHLREMTLSGSPNLVIPIVLFTVLLGLFIAALVSTLLSVFESTACLRFAGGQGCGQHPSA